MASAWSSAGLTIFALTLLARDSGAPSYSSPSTPVRARCFTLHSPHRAPTGAPYPGLPGPGYESHQSGTSGAGRPTRGGVFRPANGAASPARERVCRTPLSALSSDSDWSSLPESKWRRLRLSFRT